MSLATTAGPIGKPRLRGVSHEIACYLSALGGCYLVAQAKGPGDSDLALIGTTIYSFCLFFQFAVSALYHRPNWGALARARMRKLDHTAIYLLIAGTSTPVILLGLEGSARITALSLMWTGAALGILKSLLWIKAPKPLTAATCVMLGVAITPFLPALSRSMGAQNTWILVGGSALYILGAAVYAARRPNPLPQVFGYHEIFHALVILAAACHFGVLLRIVREVAASGSV